jgi:hypothetical protein
MYECKVLHKDSGTARQSHLTCAVLHRLLVSVPPVPKLHRGGPFCSIVRGVACYAEQHSTVQQISDLLMKSVSANPLPYAATTRSSI